MCLRRGTAGRRMEKGSRAISSGRFVLWGNAPVSPVAVLACSRASRSDAVYLRGQCRLHFPTVSFVSGGSLDSCSWRAPGPTSSRPKTADRPRRMHALRHRRPAVPWTLSRKQGRRTVRSWTL